MILALAPFNATTQAVFFGLAVLFGIAAAFTPPAEGSRLVGIGVAVVAFVLFWNALAGA